MSDLFIQRDAEFSEDGTLRLTLRRSFGTGIGRAMFIGGNPSDAGKHREDQTSHRINHFTLAWGYGENVVVNPIPKISAMPREAWEWARRRSDPNVMAALAINFAIIEREAAASALHVACWGNLLRDFPDLLAMTISVIKKPLYCLGINSDGSPRHPMSRGRNRVPNDQQPVLWRAA